MNISKKAEYAIRAIITIAKNNQNQPLQIGEISEIESIPQKFLEQILLTLKNNGILNSKRGANGGYLLGKSCDNLSIGLILEIIDGPFDPIDLNSKNDLDLGLKKCFGEMVTMVNEHLNQFTVRDILEIEKTKDVLSFEI